MPDEPNHEHTSPDTIRPMQFVIAGPLRAGTTMLRLLLDHHPSIACVGEFEEAVTIAGDTGWPTPDHYRAFLAQHRAAQAKHFPPLDTYTTTPDMVRAMWHHLASQTNKPTVGCCIHSRFDRLPELYPDLRFIILTRDPRDVSRSCVGMGWAGEPTSAVANWIDPMRRASALMQTLDPARFVRIRYEDLLAQPEAELTRCCQLLGHPYDPAMLGFHETTTYEPLDPSLAEQWRRKLTPRQAEIIDSACIPLMTQFGYQPSTPKPRPPTPREALTLALRNRLGRSRYRIRKYGLPTVVAWSLAKRLPIHNPLRTRVRARINTIDTRNLR